MVAYGLLCSQSHYGGEEAYQKIGHVVQLINCSPCSLEPLPWLADCCTIEEFRGGNTWDVAVEQVVKQDESTFIN